MPSLRLLESKQADELLGQSSASKTYAIGFLLNDEMNQAADPIPFKVSESALEKIAQSAVGKPWIPGTKGENDLHIRKPGVSDQTDVIDFHRKHAGGTIVSYYLNPKTNNVSVIVEIFPEFIDMIKNNQISEFLSPMLGNITQDRSTGEIVDAEIVHLHSVDVPGYEKKIAKFSGTCKGPIGQCMTELVAVAAAGKIKEYRDSSIACPVKFLESNKMFFNTAASKPKIPKMDLTNPSQQPPMEPTPANAPQNPDDPVMAKLDGIGASIAAMGDEIKKIEAMEDNNAGVLKELSAAGGLDPEKVMTLASMGSMNPNTPDEDEMKPAGIGAMGEQGQYPHKKPMNMMPSAGASGAFERDMEFAKMRAELDQMHKKEAIAEQTKQQLIRKNQAEIIARGEVVLHENGLTQEDMGKRVNHYFTLKNPNNPEQLIDLTLLSQKYKAVIDQHLDHTEPPKSEIAITDSIAASGGMLYDSGYPVGDAAAPSVAELDKIEERFS